MPIISLLPNLGGISIPGITNRVGGPLASLFDNTNTITTLQYPRDLGSPTRGHYVKFTVNETVEPANYDGSVAQQISNLVENPGLNSVSSFAGNIATSIGNFIKEAGASSVTNAYNVALNNTKKRQVATVALYMPETVSFSYEASYSAVSVTGAITQAASSIPKIGEGIQSISNAVNSDAAKLLLKTQGLALNPQEQLLFQGIGFRTYSLAFTFTPFSQEESETVKSIIQTFRQYAAPTLRPGAAGMFFVPPGTFNLDFYFNGDINSNVTKVAESVLTGVEVNYTPNCWSTHKDGAPIQTTMTLAFQEIELIDSNKVIEGY